tara:strand:- start:301 stop:834 length:534 start_codon:yes stop_codon:yes gene_type:complete
MNPFKFLGMTFGLYLSLVIVFGGGDNKPPEPIPTPTVFPRITVQILSPEQQRDRIAELAPSPTTTIAPVVIVEVSDDTECQQWLQTALQAGWPNDRKILDRLGFVMWRESRCQPDADSGPDHGLTQINQIHTQWITDLGWTLEEMKDPAKNLRFAWLLYSGREANGQCGWTPWSLKC